MEQHLIRRIVKVGNSAGVILPREWYGGEAKIELVVRPLDVKNDILRILGPHLNSVLGIYLVGSYARGEQREDSDVDVLVVTSKINKKVKHGNYNIIMLSEDALRSNLESRVFPIYPMLLEAKVILNSKLLEDLRSNVKIGKRNLTWYIKTTGSALNITKTLIEGEESVSSGLVYSLVLRLRGLYIADCLLHKREYNNKDFIALLKNETREYKKIWYIYNLEKEDKKGEDICINDAKKLLDLAFKMLEKQEWQLRKR